MTVRIALFALSTLLASGCASSNADTAAEPRAAENPEVANSPGDPQARSVLLEGDLDPKTIKALAHHLEGLAEVHSVEISIEKTTEGPTRARLTLGGLDMPTAAELREAVADFEGLGDVSVSVEDAVTPQGPVNAGAIAVTADADKTPEEIEAEVIEQMRADGVEGDIHVNVTDDEDGERRVEVRVEKREDRDE